MSLIAARAGQASKTRHAYRPDIDGLRALAISMVVIFHAFPLVLPGGFVGVDVFFVISGYLISGLIFDGLEKGSFRITDFYTRRIRRIFPALLLVMVVCLAYGWMVLTASEYRQLGTHVAGGAAFLDNLLFWREAGYFDNAADSKPMLHLWSLGIEEQFYLVWPLALYLLTRLRARVLLWLLACLGTSLCYSLWLVGHDAVAAFYSPLARFWELCLGAGVAHLGRQGHLQTTYWSRFGAPLGLLLLALATCYITPSSVFPGYWALLPACGTAMLIAAGMQSAINHRILANPLLVWIGLISYPLYLWHWPLLSMARIVVGHTPAIAVRLMLVLGAMVLAWLTYCFVERPIRFGKERPALTPGLCVAMLAMLLVGHTINVQKGLPFRHDQILAADTRTKVVGEDRARLRPTCLLSGTQLQGMDWCLSEGVAAPDYVVLGDSKGEALYYGMVREFAPRRHGVVMGPVNLLWGQEHQQVKSAMEAIDAHASLRDIFLVNALRGMFRVNAETGLIDGALGEPALLDMLSRYTQVIAHWSAMGRRVIFVKDNPTFPDPNDCINGGMTSSPWLNQVFFRQGNSRCRLPYSTHLAGTDAYQHFVARLQQANPKLIVLDPTPWLCDIPANLCTVTQEGRFLYSYDDHISDYANSRIARNLLSKLWPDAQ